MIESVLLYRLQESLREKSWRQRILSKFLFSSFRLAKACGITDIEGLSELIYSAHDIVGIGVDKCSVKLMDGRVKASPNLKMRVFTDEEEEYCSEPKNPLVSAQRRAGRFAAKEAVVKALGGISVAGFSYLDIGIVRQDSGKPAILLSGRPQQRAAYLGVDRIAVSITHEKDSAIAVCVAIGRHGPTPES